MQLYKKRDFSSFFSDTFQFLKDHGKHFFRHFVIINGFFVLILGALSYVFTSFFLNDFLKTFPLGNTNNEFEKLINDNFGLFIGLLVALIVTSIVFGLISYAYTPIYFKLYEKNGHTNFTTSEIIDVYKQHIGKLIMFVLCTILIAIPLTIGFGVAALILMITIVGILLLPLLIGLFAGWFNMTLLEYLDNKRGFFDCFGYAWTLITSNFWAAVGCMGIFYFMSYVVQMSLSIFQSGFNLTSQLTVPSSDLAATDSNLVFIIFTLVIFIISFFVGVILNAILQINQSVVYYGLKESSENINTISDIDLIGRDEF